MHLPRTLLFALLLSVPTYGHFSQVFAGEKPQIEKGFDLLYRLEFDQARRQFADWQKMNPRDPVGFVAMAASYLFEELSDQQVLTSRFFLNDKSLLGGIEGKPDQGRKQSFEAANRKGRELALAQLNVMPEDADALFALATASGLQADFMAILEKRRLESLLLIREAESYAKRLLLLRPDEGDAWLSLGAANYIIGSLPPYQRIFLWFGRMHGDKQLGMQQLSIAAQKGHYLKPFAEIFLALAAMREGQENVARNLLLDLAAQFPENPLYQAELTLLGNPNSVRQNGDK